MPLAVFKGPKGGGAGGGKGKRRGGARPPNILV